jgi:hypothetical protein
VFGVKYIVTSGGRVQWIEPNDSQVYSHFESCKHVGLNIFSYKLLEIKKLISYFILILVFFNYIIRWVND